MVLLDLSPFNELISFLHQESLWSSSGWESECAKRMGLDPPFWVSLRLAPFFGSLFCRIHRLVILWISPEAASHDSLVSLVCWSTGWLGGEKGFSDEPVFPQPPAFLHCQHSEELEAHESGARLLQIMNGL